MITVQSALIVYWAFGDELLTHSNAFALSIPNHRSETQTIAFSLFIPLWCSYSVLRWYCSSFRVGEADRDPRLQEFHCLHHPRSGPHLHLQISGNLTFLSYSPHTRLFNGTFSITAFVSHSPLLRMSLTQHDLNLIDRILPTHLILC